MYESPSRLTAAVSDPIASVPLTRLRSVWFQVTGLLCNLECTHCLVDSSPRNKSMQFLSRDTVRKHLENCEALGVKEIYFTGGEPFLHKEMTGILEDTLKSFPATVLTNGTLITPRLAVELGGLATASAYSLEIRISMDHPDPAQNDAVRGPGTHAKALRAVLRLQDAGLLPIVTATEFLLEPKTSGESMYDRFLKMLRKAGVGRPRLKVLPVFRTGKLNDPAASRTVTRSMLETSDSLLLQCSETRAVTAAGVYACPILVGDRLGLVGESLTGSLGPVTLNHHACITCFETGMSCGNF